MSNKRTIKMDKKYRHFKGNEYLVIYLAKHSETLEDRCISSFIWGERYLGKAFRNVLRTSRSKG